MDRAFRNEMDALINKTDDAFGRMMWREGLHSGFYAMQLLRDFYRCVHSPMMHVSRIVRRNVNGGGRMRYFFTPARHVSRIVGRID